MKILRSKMGVSLLMESGCNYVTRVVGLIPHTPLASIIHGTPVRKIFNPSPCLIPMYLKIKWYQQATQFPNLHPIMEDVLNPFPLSMTVLFLLLSSIYTIWVLTYLLLSIQFKQSMYVKITRTLFLILNSLCSFLTYIIPGI